MKEYMWLASNWNSIAHICEVNAKKVCANNESLCGKKLKRAGKLKSRNGQKFCTKCLGIDRLNVEAYELMENLA